MASLNIQEYTDYDVFARNWHADTLEDQDLTLQEARNQNLLNEDETRLLWQLLGQLDPDELVVQIPEWLAEEKVGFVDGAIPTVFVGRIERETADAILLENTAAARSLTKLAHRIHQLEQNESAADRDGWLDDRLQEHREKFVQRDDVISLQDNWLPKSQLLHVLQRQS